MTVAVRLKRFGTCAASFHGGKGRAGSDPPLVVVEAMKYWGVTSLECYRGYTAISIESLVHQSWTRYQLWWFATPVAPSIRVPNAYWLMECTVLFINIYGLFHFDSSNFISPGPKMYFAFCHPARGTVLTPQMVRDCPEYSLYYIVHDFIWSSINNYGTPFGSRASRP